MEGRGLACCTARHKNRVDIQSDSGKEKTGEMTYADDAVLRYISGDALSARQSHEG